MLLERRQIYSFSLVALGDFNPKIIQPFWLSSKALIGEKDAEDAVIELIHSEIAKFNLTWVDVLVQQSRFELKSSQEPYFEAIRDLFIGIFGKLQETPIKSLGINHIMHFSARDDQEMFNIGNNLVPLSNWDMLKNPRVLNLEIVENERRDGLNGKIRIKIQPSDLLIGSNMGFSININDHYSFSEKISTNEILRIFANQWEKSFDLAKDIVTNLEEKLFK